MAFFFSLTRLRVRSIRYLPAFFKVNGRAVVQIQRSAGFLQGVEKIDARMTFWTITRWESAAAMKQFRNNGAHQEAMRHISEWCSELSYAHWESEEAGLLGWELAVDRMQATGRFTKLRRPSAAHEAGIIAPISWHRLNRPLLPLKRLSS